MGRPLYPSGPSPLGNPDFPSTTSFPRTANKLDCSPPSLLPFSNLTGKVKKLLGKLPQPVSPQGDTDVMAGGHRHLMITMLLSPNFASP